MISLVTIILFTILYILLLVLLILLIFRFWGCGRKRLLFLLLIIGWLIFGLLALEAMEHQYENGGKAVQSTSKDCSLMAHKVIKLKASKVKTYKFPVLRGIDNNPCHVEITFKGVKCYESPVCVDSILYQKSIGIKSNIDSVCDDITELDIFKQGDFVLTVNYLKSESQIIIQIENGPESLLKGHIYMITNVPQ